MTTQLDILIIGGGISGLLAARELRLAGREVTVIDKAAMGQESSWAGGGILLPIYPWRQAPAISELVRKSLAIYPGLSQTLLEATGIDPEWTPCGMLICKNPDLQLARQWCADYAVREQPVTATLKAGLNTEWQQPLWLPDIAQARNPRLLKSLLAYLRQIGVTIIEHAPLSKISVAQGRVHQVEAGGVTYGLQQLVVSSGAWTAELLGQLLPDWPLNLPIKPVRGQMLLFDAQPETLRYMVLDGDHYLIPRRDGKILAGSSVEQAGFDKTPTAEVKQRLYAFATELLPALKACPLSQHWAGLRPGSPDGVPYIGYHPQLDNLSINVGHFRNGLVMGPASAQLLADLILQRSPSVDPQPYALTR